MRKVASTSLLAVVVVVGGALAIEASEGRAAASAGYPQRPIRLVIPFPVGGPVDLVARAPAARLAEALGYPVIVDNRPGAGGGIGADLVAKAPPDGYTLLWGSAGPLAINVALYAKLPYDPVRDFAPITQTVATQVILVLHPSMAANSVRELIDYARANPDRLTYASVGNGTSPHLAMELFKMMTGTDFRHIPYKGGASAMTDLVSGRVPLMFIAISSALPYVKAGRLKALAVATQRRAQAMPELPTVAEAGVPGYDASTWHGLVAPAATPRAIVTRLHAEMVRILRQDEMKLALIGLGAEPVGSTPEQFAAYIRGEIAKWKPVVKASGMTVD
jgi:tripartite-type tricarboxylate transporter receptor subunit TctC